MFRIFFSLLNENQGVLTLLLFIITLVLGWISGLFETLRQRPRLSVELIDGPTFCCTFPTGRQFKGFDAHRTGVALYLNITNVGSAPTDIAAIEVGYHWHLRPFSKQWLKYRIGWFWLRHQSLALDEFQAKIGGAIKIYPFLIQHNNVSPATPKTYLRIGESTNGVVYFEQTESWGRCFPIPIGVNTKVKLHIKDAFGKSYFSTHKVPIISLDEARRYNPRFGDTLEDLRDELIHNRETEIVEPPEGVTSE